MTLNQRAVACKGWRWLPGSRTKAGGRRLTDTGARSIPPINAVPDFDDPATLGCLLALVREAFRDAAIYASTENDGTWGVFNTGDGIITHKHDTETDALISALECAP